MTEYSSPPLSLQGIAHAIGTLRQLEQHIDVVRQDFMPGKEASQLPSEVTQFHLKREIMALERQIRSALIVAFGEHSSQVSRFRDLGFAAATSRSFQDGMVILDGFIFDLEQKRLHLLDAKEGISQAGIDALTDFYTERMLKRYLDHEVAWSQRQGEPFGLLLLRPSRWTSFRRQHDETIVKELVISMACVLKTSVRGYDFPCRLKEVEFGLVLRQMNELTINVVVQRIGRNFRAATHRVLPGVVLPLEFACAIYPYDAETIPGLFACVEKHWIISPSSSSDGLRKRPSTQPKPGVTAP
jgi:GGDEF domain-containing protein